MQLLNQIKKYSNDLAQAHQDDEMSAEEKRLRGVELIQVLKENVEHARRPPEFAQTLSVEIQGTSLSRKSRSRGNLQSHRDLHMAASSEHITSGRQDTQQSAMKERVLTPAEEREDRLNKLEVYIKCKDNADSFYYHLVETIEDIDIEDVINKYCQSAISLDSLESQHKNKEVQKQTKQRQTKEHQEYLYCLLRENSMFGKYFQ